MNLAVGAFFLQPKKTFLKSLKIVMAAPPPYYAVASNQNNMSNNTDAPLSKVALNISCKNLANMDVLSKSDPQVFVFLVDAQQNETLIDKTEKIQNDLNPKFGKTISLLWLCEE